MSEPRRLSFVIYPLGGCASFWIRPSGISSLVGVDGVPFEMEYGKTIAMCRMAALMACEEAGNA